MMRVPRRRTAIDRIEEAGRTRVPLPAVPLGGGAADFGIVEVLPGSPAKGDRCTFKAAAGIYWQLIYAEEAEFPWAKIGGPPLREFSNGTTEFTSAAFTPSGIELKPPLKGIYTAQHGIFAQLVGLASSNFYSALFNAGAEDEQTRAAFIALSQFAGASIVSAPKSITLAKEAVVNQRVRGFTETRAWQIAQKWIALDPLRVG